MQAVEWPARLQPLTKGPLAQRLPAGWELWLDGGHNDSGGEVLADQAKAWACEKNALPLVIIFGMLNTKKIASFLGPMAPYISQLRAVAIPDEPLSLTAEQAENGARYRARDCGQILQKAFRQRSTTWSAQAKESAARILICGSLYLAGKVLAMSGL